MPAPTKSTTAVPGEKIPVLVLTLLGFGVFLNAWLMYRSPNIDATEWLVGGRGLLKGVIPYRDTFVHVGPLMNLIMGFWFLIFKPHIITAAVAYLASNLLTAFGTFKLARCWMNRSQSALAAGIFLLCLPFFGGSDMFAEPHVAVFGVWGIYFLARPNRTLTSVGIGSLLTLLAFLTKQTGLVYFGAWVGGQLLYLITADSERRRKIVIELAVADAVFVTGIGITCLIFAMGGLLNAFLFDFFLYCLVVKTPFTPPSFILDVYSQAAPWLFFLALLGIFWGKQAKSGIPFYLGMAVIPILIVWLKASNFRYIIIVIPFLALYAVEGLYLILDHWNGTWKKKAGLAALALMLIPTVGRVGIAIARPFFGINPALAQTLKNTPIKIGLTVPHTIFADMKVAEKLKEALPPVRKLYCVSSPLYYFFLGRDFVWNGDMLSFHPPEWIFKTVDGILVLRMKESPDDSRPPYIDDTFTEMVIPLDIGAYRSASFYSRQVDPTVPGYDQPLKYPNADGRYWAPPPWDKLSYSPAS